MFQSREQLRYAFPILDRYPWLLPFLQPVRWVRLLLDGKLRRITTELSANNHMDKDYQAGVIDLLAQLNLK